jgi:hypothetical protein
MRLSYFQIRLWICLALIGSNFVSPSIFAAAKVVSSTVGQVGGYVITSREVVIAGVVEKWLMNPNAKNKNNWIMSVNSTEFKQALTQVMLEKVVVLEAENFSVAQVTPDEIQKNVVRMSEDLKDWSEWKKLEVSNLELDNQFQRHMRAKAFLKFKTESTGVRVNEEEARQYFEKNHVRFGNVPFAQFKESIRDYLTQKQQEDRLRDWFEVLKRKYRVRYLSSPV